MYNTLVASRTTLLVWGSIQASLAYFVASQYANPSPLVSTRRQLEELKAKMAMAAQSSTAPLH
ncbi:hypothetical protein D9758_001592 [Tetrapyrgos nigripes]|uniref:Uncharacterized protein n=1 Tax=Tetrapyrgos nigripes TaxID=182062 RepID=A0A8H5LXI7_9AGAR|nr:hypothetical protein D9758_001592 [Tetrapyrgos nigripes]